MSAARIGGRAPFACNQLRVWIAAVSSAVGEDAAARCRSAVYLTFLIIFGRGDPLIKLEGGSGGIEDRAAIDDAERVLHAQAQALDCRGKVPWVDAVAIDGGLAAHCLQARPIQKGRKERMIVERLVEACEGARGPFKRRKEPQGGQQVTW